MNSEKNIQESKESIKYPLISITMLNWNGLEDTKVALESLKKSTYPNVEIIIVDNGSVDGSKEWLANQDGIVYLDLDKNYGVTGGHIKGFNIAKGDFIANLNNDTIVDPEWLMELYRPFLNDELVAVTGGKAYEWNDNNPVYNTNNSFFSYQVIDLFGGYAHTMHAGDKLVSINSISTVGALMKKSVIEKVGFFDDDFFAYYDETDLFARIKRAGFKVVYTPKAYLWHMVGKSTKGFPYFYLYQMHRNRFYFAIKNYDKEYVWPFIKQYSKDSLRGTYHWLRGSNQLSDKAQMNAFTWNIFHFFDSYKKRKHVMKLGPKYNKLLVEDAAQFVSVIITCFNYENYVAEAIKSVLEQTETPLEIIVINDGSTDESMKQISLFKDRVTIVDRPNEGVISAKNQGLEMAKGEWILFLDADDILKPNYIKETLKYARLHNYDVVYTDMLYFGAKEEKMPAKNFSFGELLNGNFIHNSSLYKKQLLQKVGGYKKEMHGGYEDWELNISLAEIGAKFGYLKKSIFMYRQHGSDKGRNNQAQENAKELVNVVKNLHQKTYILHSFKIRKIIRGVRVSIKHPSIILLAILYTPYSLLIASVSFLRSFKSTLMHKLYRHVHTKKEKIFNVNDDLNE